MKIYKILMALVLFTAVRLYAQSVDGQFITSLSGTKYTVKVASSMQTGTGTAGVVYVEFTFNNSALSLPMTLVSGKDYVLQGGFASYSGNVTRPAANSVRISLAPGEGVTPVDLTTAPTNIILFNMTVLDPSAQSDLVWTKTQIAPALLQSNYATGNWPNLSQSLLPPTVDGQFITDLIGTKFDVTIAANMRSGTGKAGVITLEFTFNNAALSIPGSPVINVDYELSGDFALYPTKNLTWPAANTLRISLGTAGSPAPVTLTTTPLNIIKLHFTVTNPNAATSLTWTRTEVAPALGQSNYAVGNWPSLSSTPLPVQLVSFDALPAEEEITLKWKTATEVNNYGFEVERKNSTWEKIGFVQGHGNSNSPVEYTFTDNKFFGGTEFQYRLKQIDNNGEVKYYDPVKVKVAAPKEYKLMQNTPNPFNPSTAIKFSLPENSFVTVKVYNILGREVATLSSEIKPAGSHIVFWNGRDNDGLPVSSGIYLYRLQAGKYVETRKMNLLK